MIGVWLEGGVWRQKIVGEEVEVDRSDLSIQFNSVIIKANYSFELALFNQFKFDDYI